jgi:hypothetical protein
LSAKLESNTQLAATRPRAQTVRPPDVAMIEIEESILTCY